MGSLGNDGAQTLGPDGPSLRMEMVGWSGFLPSPLPRVVGPGEVQQNRPL